MKYITFFILIIISITANWFAVKDMARARKEADMKDRFYVCVLYNKESSKFKTVKDLVGYCENLR